MDNLFYCFVKNNPSLIICSRRLQIIREGFYLSLQLFFQIDSKFTVKGFLEPGKMCFNLMHFDAG